MASKATRAIEALREAADALRDLPDGLKRRPPFLGSFAFSPEEFEEEANYIEAQARAVMDATQGDLFDGN